MDLGAQDLRATADALTVKSRGIAWPGRRAGRLVLVAAGLLLAAAALACALPGQTLAEGLDDDPFAEGLTTTGPTPPPGVLPPSSARGALAGAGEVLLAGVPAYIWHDGCAPTSLGMILGYWDAHGYPALIPGDAAAQTRWVDQAIASHGSEGAPRHYEDYALPRESGGLLLRDRSESPAGDEHANDSAADLMHTSRSADGLAYGWTWTDRVGPAFVHFVGLRLAQASANSEDYSVEDPESVTTMFSLLQNEIDAGRPMVFYVDSDGNGAIDHAVAAVGYRVTSGYAEYACWDTWYSQVRWEQFRAPEAGYRWGVGGATQFTLTGPATPADVSGPVTTVAGGDGWSRPPLALSVSATDDRAGVDFVEADVDGAGWTPLAGLPARLEVTGQGEHTVTYRATDIAGNVGDVGEVTLHVDGDGPVTSARAARVRQGARVSLRYRVDDVTPQARVRLVLRTLSGRARATLRPGWRATGALLGTSWRATLPRGVYRLWVYATDEAGNGQVTPGSARITIR